MCNYQHVHTHGQSNVECPTLVLLWAQGVWVPLFVSIALVVESYFPTIDIYLGSGKVTVLEKIEKD